jgi:hypothetical protein
MAVNEVVITKKVKFSGIANCKNLYKFVNGYLVDEGYDVNEDVYEEKIIGDSKSLGITWTADKKLDDYFKSSIKMSWRIGSVRDVEVEVDGKKKAMNKISSMTINVKGTLVSDYGGNWSGSGLQKILKGTYHKYVVPEKIEKMQGKVFGDVEDLCSEMKAFLDLLGK